MRHACDVCIFGGGPAGVAIGVRLADLGYRCVLADRPSRVKPWGGESFSGAIQQPLSSLGLWEDFLQAGHVAGYAQRTGWGSEPWVQDSIFHPHGPRWHVDRSRFDDDLRAALEKRGIPILKYQSLEEIRREGKEWQIGLDGGRQISAKYLVDATGRACAIGRRLGVKPRVYDRLIGLTTLISRNENPEYDHTMVIETNAHGWWYAAPVPQGHVLAFFTDSDLVPREMTRAMRTVVANSTFTEVKSGQGWLPAGDACAAHDPLCGWGVHRALSNGIIAADAIGYYLEHSDESRLDAYHQHCRDQFEKYLQGLIVRYSHEQRWSESPFWKRRANSLALHA